jgi:hypothetical protein
MNIKKLSLIVSVMISLFTIGTPAAENFFSVNNQIFADIPDDANTNQQLARVRAATAKYHDINAALEDGYILLAPGTCIENDQGVAGIHYVNVPRFVSPELNIEEPELLVYVPTGDGNLRLVAVEYANRALYRDTRPPDTPGYRPGVFPSQQNPRPPYLEEVSGPFTLFDQPSEGPIFVGRWLYFLHVWVWSPNPNGMFADGNPRLNCTANN